MSVASLAKEEMLNPLSCSSRLGCSPLSHRLKKGRRLYVRFNIRKVLGLAVLNGFTAALGGCTEEPPTEHSVEWVNPHETIDHTGRLSQQDSPKDTLHMQRVLGLSGDFERVAALKLIGGRLLVSDRMTSPHLSLIDLGTGNIIERLGYHGTDTKEFQSPEWMYPDPGDSNTMWIFDDHLYRFSTLQMQSDGRTEIELSRAPPPAPGMTNPIFTSGQLMSNGLFAGHTFEIRSATGPSRRVVANLPFPYSELPFYGQAMLNRNRWAPQIPINRVAAAYQFAPRIDVLDTTGRFLKTIIGPREAVPTYKFRSDIGSFAFDDLTQMAYVAVESTASHIYALFCGHCTSTSRFPTLLHIYTWDGAFVREVAFDRPVKTFTVSSDGLRIFGYFEVPTPQIGEWMIGPQVYDLELPS
jgi:hypothetical protein